MKKLNLLLIVSMLAAALLAANPPGKLVRLEVINASGDTVYMRLQGRITGAFYYLTIPRGWTKTFTVLVDSYARTTWACGGVTSRGSLNMTGNVKLKFVLCGKYPVRVVHHDYDKDGLFDAGEWIGWAPNFGEPTQEKVVYYFGYMNWTWLKVAAYQNPLLPWDSFSVWLRIKLPFAWWQLKRMPRGNFMRYRY